MSESRVHHHVLPNGLTLIAEVMPGVQSASFSFLLPAGAVHEPAERPGMASMVGEWIMRGAGERDSRELLDALDNLGVNHSAGAQTVHASVSAAALGRNLEAAIEIFADVLQRPHLEEEEVEPIRALALQSLQSLEDDPGSKVIYELRKRYFSDPWGRSAPGTESGLEASTAEEMRAFFRKNYRAGGTILAVAGAVNWPALRDSVERLLGDWPRGEGGTIEETAAGPKRDHLVKETQQIQIALAHGAVPLGHSDYYLARSSTAILGGYSSARLFTEVREKRGLCYSVYAGYESFKDRAAVLCYAGTSADRAQETLDVTLAEIKRLAATGIEQEELDTMRAGLKSALIMQQESTMSRAGSLAADWYYLGRIRPLEEISAAMDALTPAMVNEYLARERFDDLTILTLGPNKLVLPE